MARCLVTGAAGFIGRHLVAELLAAGHEVTCFVRPRSPHNDRLNNLPVRVCAGDMLSGDGLAAAVAGQDQVFHLAGLVRALSRQTLWRVNAEGVGRLMAVCAASPTPPTVVVLSSLAAGGPAIDGRPVEIDDPPRLLSNYGRSKLAGEREAGQYAARLPITIVRPPIVFGGGDPFTLQWFQSLARFRLHIVPGRAESRYSLVYVGDLVRVLVLAAAQGVRLPPNSPDAGPVGPGIYYAAHPEALGYAELGRRLSRAMGLKRILCPRLPMPLMRLFGALSETAGQLMRRPAWIGWDKIREAAAGSWVCSPQSVVAGLGFGFPTPLDEQFTATVEAHRRDGFLQRKVGPCG